jgi:hypothetical protein
MALRNRQEDDQRGYNWSEAGRDFLRLGGGYSPTGAAYYMMRVVISGTTASVCMGLGGAAIGAAFYGTAALPFLIFSCAGFAFGAIGFHRVAMRESLIMLERYPRLLQLHLDANFPHRDFLSWRREQMRAATFSQSWVLKSMLMVAWLTAQPAVEVLANVATRSFRVLT